MKQSANDMQAIAQGITPDVWVGIGIIGLLVVFFIGSVAHYIYGEIEWRRVNRLTRSERHK